MDTKSKDMKAEEAKAAIAELGTPDEVRAFIEGDERKSVIDAADARIKKLDGKEGDTGPLTQTKNVRGGGIEGTKTAEKPVTCQDVIDRMRAEGRKI